MAPVTGPFPTEFDPGQRNVFGELAVRSGRMLNALSHAQVTGAENLLTKAMRALDAGEAQRSEQLIRRAAQMPYDAREEWSPGVHAAVMLVYNIISDEFEDSEHDDMTWLDVVIDVYSDLDPTAQSEVASEVHGFVLQKGLFDVTAAEKRRIQRAFGDAPLEAELGDLPNATVEQRQDIIRSLTMAAMALDDAYAAAAEGRHL